jgi:hypothetical protein
VSIAQLQQSERSFERAVVEYAEYHGWRTAHFNDSRREVVDRRTGERKLIGDKDAKGFPDRIFARKGRIVIAELKAEKGRLSGEQKEWLEALGSPGGDPDPVGVLALELRGLFPRVWVACWRPSQWSEIEQVLR